MLREALDAARPARRARRPSPRPRALHLRAAFLRARVAISGANFAVAETGTVCVVESEGNGRMCTTLPETLITVMGIEKVVAEWRDLGVLLQLLPRSATGERMNPYTSLWTGVRAGDGPTAFHLVLLDAGRTRALADPEGRPALRCIRCSACVNVCPVYRQTGGHAYPTVYAGPIGAILQPQLAGERGPAASLPYASSLCGACADVCPVGIDIPRILVHERAKVVRRTRPGLEGRALRLLGAGVLQRRALRARAAHGARAPAARAPRRPPALAPGPARGLGTLARRCPVSRSRRSASGGRRVTTAREEVLARIRAALDGRRAHRECRRRYRRRARSRPRGGARTLFVERVEETGATVLRPGGRRRRRRRRARPTRSRPRRRRGRTSTPVLRPPAADVVVDDGLGRRELDALDGAVTTCAAACADTGTIAFDGGPGQGRRADHARARPPRLRRPRRAGGRDGARALRAAGGLRPRGPPARPRLRARRRPPTSASSASRASTDHDASSSCSWLTSPPCGLHSR